MQNTIIFNRNCCSERLPQRIPGIYCNSAPVLLRETHFVCLSKGYECPFIIIAKKMQLPSKEFLLVLCKGTLY